MRFIPDPTDPVTTGGVVAAIIVLVKIIEKLVEILISKTKKGGDPGEDFLKKLNYVKEKVEDLWDWHNKEDEDGVKKWYNKASSYRSIQKNSEALTKCLRKLQQIEDTLSKEGDE